MRKFAAIIFSLLSGLAFSGAEPVSHSNVDYFLAYQLDGADFEAYISVGSSPRLLDRIKELCKENGMLFGFGVTSPFKCRSYKERDGVDERLIAVLLRNERKLEEFDNFPVLFSVAPFRKATWKKVYINSNDKLSISQVLSKQKGKYIGAINGISKAGISALLLGDGRRIYIVHWEVDNNEFSNDIYSLILVGGNERVRLVGELEGTIRGYVDNDGLPELIVSSDCDGRCEYLYNIKDSIKPLVEISVH